MVAFDASGNVKWSVPGYSPDIATADGGIIADDGQGSGYTFDATGNANGQLPSLPTYSWLGNAYQLGSIVQISLQPPRYLSTFAALFAGNNSANGTAIQPTWYPQLASCTDTTLKPPPACPAPREQIYNAWKKLIGVLSNNATNPGYLHNITVHVFAPLAATTGQSYSLSGFIEYLERGLSAYDGTVSVAPANKTVLPGTSDSTHVQKTFDSCTYAETEPSKTPLSVFFNPAKFDPSLNGANTANVAMVFHEALHGLTGLSDLTLQQNFGLSRNTNSLNITNFLIPYLVPPMSSTTVSCSP